MNLVFMLASRYSSYNYVGRNMYYYWDPTYFLVLIGVVLSLLASSYIKSSFAKYARTSVMSRMTGAEVAQMILQRNGVNGVRVTRVSGNLTDHFNPRTGEVALSDSVYNSTSISAVSVAAHECGHVLQHEQGYLPIQIRTALVPVADLGSKISWFLIILGLILSIRILIPIGIVLFCAAVLFQIVTLPVEFNASRRGLVFLREYGVVTEAECRGAKSVLRAAAMTYVAAAATAILQLLRLILIARRRD